MTIFIDDHNAVMREARLAFLFGMLIVGNVVDNVATPRTLVIVLQLGLAFCWFINGWELEIALKEESCNEFKDANGDLAELFSAGVILTNTIQVYNWFSRKYIQIILIGYFLM